MYIIDKNKDFYDYYSHIYGVDKKVVYDRRGSNIIDDETIARLSEHYNPISGEKSIRFVLLEIGFTQYLIKLFNFQLEDTPYSYKKIIDYDIECVNTFKDFKHRFSTPVSIRGVKIGYLLNWGWWNNGAKNKYKYITDGSYDQVVVGVFDNEIKNPILGNTKFTSFLDPHDVWVELQTYISSLDNDVDCSTEMNDVDRAEIHGFDKKTSFRNPIK